MKKIIFLFVLGFLTLQVNAQKVNWIPFEEAVELTKKEPKPILIDVYTDWCGYCKKMDRITYSNNVISEYINENFYPVKLNGEQKENIVFNGHTFKFINYGRTGYNEFTASLLNGKLSYPTTVFMNDRLELLDRVPGYLNPKIMEQVITFFGASKYKINTWQDFIKTFKSNL